MLGRGSAVNNEDRTGEVAELRPGRGTGQRSGLQKCLGGALPRGEGLDVR